METPNNFPSHYFRALPNPVENTTVTLAKDITSKTTRIPVRESLKGWPRPGFATIDGECVYYQDIRSNTFLGCVRGISSDDLVRAYTEGTTVLPTQRWTR